MSSEHGTPQAEGPAATSPAATPSGTPAEGPARTGLTGMLAPAVVLLVVGALALAALTGGPEEVDTAAEQAATADGEEALDELPDELATDSAEELDEQVTAEQRSQEEIRAQLDALATRQPDDPRAIGEVDAPVAMVQWADFLCPFCGVFARDTEPELIDRYVESGILRIEWRDLPFQGDQALLAAAGGQAAAAQGAFWEYHDAMFAADLRQAEERVDREFLLAVAAELDLDVAAFEQALDDPELTQRVQGEAMIAQSLGITGTPAFIVGGYPTVGAQPLDTFVNLIENAAIEAGAELP